MPELSATISELRIEDQHLLGRVSVVGDPGEHGRAWMRVYDASGTERHSSDLGRMDAGQPWELQLDVDGSGLEDGDYGVWISVVLVDAGGAPVDSVQEGVSFLVGRGEVYPSLEAADRRTDDAPVEVTNVRLEGSWVVFDMVNTARFDVGVSHTIEMLDGTNVTHTARGEELVRGGATQQGHHLLPEGMANGRYSVLISLKALGSAVDAIGTMNIDVHDGVVTIAP